MYVYYYFFNNLQCNHNVTCLVHPCLVNSGLNARCISAYDALRANFLACGLSLTVAVTCEY